MFDSKKISLLVLCVSLLGAAAQSVCSDNSQPDGFKKFVTRLVEKKEKEIGTLADSMWQIRKKSGLSDYDYVMKKYNELRDKIEEKKKNNTWNENDPSYAPLGQEMEKIDTCRQCLSETPSKLIPVAFYGKEYVDMSERYCEAQKEWRFCGNAAGKQIFLPSDQKKELPAYLKNLKKRYERYKQQISVLASDSFNGKWQFKEMVGKWKVPGLIAARGLSPFGSTKKQEQRSILDAGSEHMERSVENFNSILALPTTQK